MRDIGVEPAQIAALAGLYVLHVATFDAQVNHIERSPVVQVEWLHRTRTELARLLEARLLEDARRGAGRGARAA